MLEKKRVAFATLFYFGGVEEKVRRLSTVNRNKMELVCVVKRNRSTECSENLRS